MAPLRMRGQRGATRIRREERTLAGRGPGVWPRPRPRQSPGGHEQAPCQRRQHRHALTPVHGSSRSSGSSGGRLSASLLTLASAGGPRKGGRRTGSSRGRIPGMSMSVCWWRRLCLGLCLAASLAPTTAITYLVNGTYDLPIMMKLKSWYGRKVDLSSWQPKTECYKWMYVNCNTDRVSGIYLQSLRLGGPFPSIITGLKYLRWVYMDGNDFTGRLPNELSKNTRLEVLKLSGNQLTGTLPPSLVTLPKLYKIYLKQNKISGNIPAIWSLRGFQEAYFDSNKMSGPFPSQVICNWTGLQKLRIGANAWTGNFPQCISKLTDMVSLYIDNTMSLRGSIPKNIGNMKNLRQFFIHGNRLTGPIPPSIGLLTNLDTFFLSSNRITGPIPKTIGNLKSIGSWVMENNIVDGTIPTEVGKMTSIQRILWDNNRLSGPIPASIGNLKQLTILLLEGNSLSGTVPPEIGLGCSKLNQFNLETNWLSGPPPSVFTSNNLAQINIRANYFVGKVDYKTPSGKPICPPLKISTWIHSSSAYNCLTQNATCGPAYNEIQRKRSACKVFCGADGPNGACNGKGTCKWVWMSKPKGWKGKPAACTCFKGHKPTRDLQSCI